jgi:hypothetical protein
MRLFQAHPVIYGIACLNIISMVLHLITSRQLHVRGACTSTNQEVVIYELGLAFPESTLDSHEQ